MKIIIQTFMQSMLRSISMSWPTGCIKMLMLAIIAVCWPVAVDAQSLKAEGPEVVSVGGNFRIEYTSSSSNMSHFSLGDIPGDAFDVVFGPAVSTLSSARIINGKMTQESSTTYTYTLVARKSGTYTIPAATATVDGKKVTSNALRILVSGESSHPVATSDIFMQLIPSKTHVYEQEPLTVTLKLYTSSQPTNLMGELGDVKDFMVTQLDDPRRQVTIAHELVGGRPYITLEWHKYLLFPQKSGRLEIPAIPFEVTTIRRLHNIDPFEEFMNGGAAEVYDKHTVKTKPLTIEVEALPTAPEGFNGAVGQFDIESALDNTTPSTNDVVTMKVKVSGRGNLNMVTRPVVEFPVDFDTYDPQTNNQSQPSGSGYEGSVEYEYTAVPRNAGQYDIAPVRLVYFDPQAREYKTATADGYHLKVSRGKTAKNGGSDYSSTDDDSGLRPIRQGSETVRTTGDSFFGSRQYLLLLGVLLVVFVSLFVVFRQRAIERADIVKSRSKRATSVATKRLRKAARLMKSDNSGAFYDETLRALWGYVGDRLNMPVEQLSRDNVSGRLSERHVVSTSIDEFIAALDECEYARYAPGDATGNMQKVYEKSVKAIDHIEADMKRKVKNNAATAIAVLLLLLSTSTMTARAQSTTANEPSIPAATKQEADAAYLAGEYQQATVLYEEVLKKGKSAEVYYNLGNAYYQTERLTLAILNYERALALSPGDADARHNLQLARSKTVDRVTPQSEMFFVTWYRALTHLLSSDQWAWLAVGALGVAVVLALFYLFAGGLVLRKVGFLGAVVMLVVFLLSNLFGWQQQHDAQTQQGAVVMTAVVKVKTTPSDTGRDAFTLHEGTTVSVTDNGVKGWCQISVADGRSGWLSEGDIEMI